MTSKVGVNMGPVLKRSCERCFMEDFPLDDHDFSAQSILTKEDVLKYLNDESLDSWDSRDNLTLLNDTPEPIKVEAKFTSISRKFAGSAALPSRINIPYCTSNIRNKPLINGWKSKSKYEVNKRHRYDSKRCPSSSPSTSSLLKTESEKPRRPVIPRKISTLSDPCDITEILLLEAESSCDPSSTNQSRTQSPSRSDQIIRDEQNNEQINQLDEQLSAWAKWLIEKEQIKRRMKKKQKEKQMKQLEEKYQKMNLKMERQEKANRKWQEWLKNKENLLKEQKQAEEAHKLQEEMRKQQIQSIKIQKSRAKFEEWCQRKAQEEKDKQNMQKQLEDNKNRWNQSRAQAALIAYSKWLNESRSKEQLPHYSKGYADGKLIDYYDRTANPAPSYVNPNPWKDIIEPNNSRATGSKKRK